MNFVGDNKTYLTYPFSTLSYYRIHFFICEYKNVVLTKIFIRLVIITCRYLCPYFPSKIYRVQFFEFREFFRCQSFQWTKINNLASFSVNLHVLTNSLTKVLSSTGLFSSPSSDFITSMNNCIFETSL